MSVLESLMENGVEAEDLEKAASARLFIDACTEEGIDLSEHTEADIESAYESWMEENFGGEKQAGEEEEASAEDIFLAQCAEEGIDLNDHSPNEVQAAFNSWYEEQTVGGESKTASADEVEEAHAKLAEVEILGRHMARMYVDELDKVAASASTKASQRALGLRGPRGGVAPAAPAAPAKKGRSKAITAQREAAVAAENASRSASVASGRAEGKSTRAAAVEKLESRKATASPGAIAGRQGIKNLGGAAREADREVATTAAEVRGLHADHGPANAGAIRRGAGRVAASMRAHPYHWGGGALAAGGLAAGGLALGRRSRKSKTASDEMFDELVEARVEELAASLNMSGDIPDREYTSDLDESVDSVALEIMAEHGLI